MRFHLNIYSPPEIHIKPLPEVKRPEVNRPEVNRPEVKRPEVKVSDS